MPHWNDMVENATRSGRMASSPFSKSLSAAPALNFRRCITSPWAFIDAESAAMPELNHLLPCSLPKEYSEKRIFIGVSSRRARPAAARLCVSEWNSLRVISGRSRADYHGRWDVKGSPEEAASN